MLTHLLHLPLGLIALALGSSPLLAQSTYIKASNAGAGDRFGTKIAISGNTMVVGAFGEASSGFGVNGDQSDNSEPGAGAAYVFEFTGTAWTQSAYLKAENSDASDFFGSSVAISGDTIVVGASGDDSSAIGVNGSPHDNGRSASGAAYVFVRQGPIWAQEAYIKAARPDEGDAFGSTVAISGNTIAVGAIWEGGSSTGENGDQLDNSLPGTGALYVFTRTGTTWSQQSYLKASNPGVSYSFASSLAIDGDTIVAGTINERSRSSGVNGTQDDDNSIYNGAAYIFTRTGTSWSQEAYLKASNSDNWWEFGSSVDVSGDTVVVGAQLESNDESGVNGDQFVPTSAGSGSGAVYVFVRSGASWTQQAYIKSSNTWHSAEFGSSVSLENNTLLVGARGEKSHSAGIGGDQEHRAMHGAGAAYVFSRSGAAWSQQAYLKASNPDRHDRFGSSTALAGNKILVSALDEDGGFAGIDGNQSSDFAVDAGAVYEFDLLRLSETAPSFCFGDGFGRPCRCGNNDTANRDSGGCLNSSGRGALLKTNGASSVSYNRLLFEMVGGVPNSFAVLTSGDSALGGGLGILGQPGSDGLRCVGSNFRRHGGRGLDANGATWNIWAPPTTGSFGFVSGQTRNFQARYRVNPLASPCGFGSNTTQAIRITFAP